MPFSKTTYCQQCEGRECISCKNRKVIGCKCPFYSHILKPLQKGASLRFIRTNIPDIRRYRKSFIYSLKYQLHKSIHPLLNVLKERRNQLIFEGIDKRLESLQTDQTILNIEPAYQLEVVVDGKFYLFSRNNDNTRTVREISAPTVPYHIAQNEKGSNYKKDKEAIVRIKGIFDQAIVHLFTMDSKDLIQFDADGIVELIIEYAKIFGIKDFLGWHLLQKRKSEAEAKKLVLQHKQKSKVKLEEGLEYPYDIPF